MPSSQATERPSSLLPLGMLVILALLALTLMVSLRGGTRGFGESHPAVGTELHSLDLKPLINVDDGVTLDDLSGKIVLINYWGPWCRPCRVEMPYLVELESELAEEDDFRFISVSCGIQQVYSDLAELRWATDDYAQRVRIQFPIYADPSGDNRAALAEVARLSSFGYPTSVLLDREHVIQALWAGYKDGVDIEMKAVTLGVLHED